MSICLDAGRDHTTKCQPSHVEPVQPIFSLLKSGMLVQPSIVALGSEHFNLVCHTVSHMSLQCTMAWRIVSISISFMLGVLSPIGVHIAEVCTADSMVVSQLVAKASPASPLLLTTGVLDLREALGPG